MKVNGIQVELPKIELSKEIENNKEVVDKGFGDKMVEAINDVNTMQVTSNQAIENMLTGKSRNIHETMIALEKADISLKLMTSVKNKAMESYNQIMRMQV